uniref:Uncharacterized protein n=1 Tax=Rhizophora mucronata TaxID=61149 RepID=A0A2P2QLD7_RHIMU
MVGRGASSDRPGFRPFYTSSNSLLTFHHRRSVDQRLATAWMVCVQFFDDGGGASEAPPRVREQIENTSCVYFLFSFNCFFFFLFCLVEYYI